MKKYFNSTSGSLKIHSRHLHDPLCGIFASSSKIVKLFFLFAVILTMATAISIPAQAASQKTLKDVRKAPVKKGDWVKRGTKWKYRYTNKTYAKNTWLKINGKYYYFKSSGYMDTGWKTYNRQKYYLNKNGDMATGWVPYKKKWYYFNKNGTMASNKWITYKKQKYYVGAKGVMAAGWKTIQKKKYYFNKNGQLMNGWAKVKNDWYYLKKDGSLSSYKKASQMIFVEATGSTAEFTMLERKNDTTWNQILSTTAYVGRRGVGPTSEGLATTPEGTYSFGVAFGNNSSPGTAFPYTKINPSHYWVDDPNSQYYNKLVSTKNVTPDWNSAEHLSEYPTAYAYALSINYNTACTPGAGSAIFLHCFGGGATAGCVAIPEQDMVFVLQHIKRDALIHISRK